MYGVTCDMLRTLASRWNKQKFRCYEAKIEESEKAGSRRESNPGHLACAASALPLSYDNRTTTSPHNPLLCTAQVGLKCLSCNTWQPLSMCRQNSVRGRPENSLHQERTHAEWFSQSKCLELLPHVGINRSLDVMRRK